MRAYRSEKQWQAIIKDQEQSGQSIAAYCRQNKISISGFYNQNKKCKEQSETSTRFVCAQVTQKTETAIIQQTPTYITLELKGTKLSLPTSTPADYLASLLNGLSS